VFPNVSIVVTTYKTIRVDGTEYPWWFEGGRTVYGL